MREPVCWRPWVQSVFFLSFFSSRWSRLHTSVTVIQNNLTWRHMKRVYGLRDNTTEHSEYTRLAEQLMRPEWAQLRRELKWAVTTSLTPSFP